MGHILLRIRMIVNCIGPREHPTTGRTQHRRDGALG